MRGIAGPGPTVASVGSPLPRGIDPGDAEDGCAEFGRQARPSRYQAVEVGIFG